MILMSIVHPSGPLYGAREFDIKAEIYLIKNTVGLSLLKIHKKFF